MSEPKLPALVAAVCLTALALPSASAQQTPTQDSAAVPPAAETRLLVEGEALAEVAKRVARGDRLADTGRYSEALKEYRYALSLLKKAGRGDGELRARVQRLSKSLAVVRFDLADVPDGSYLELAVDGRVVPANAVRNGWMVRGGTVAITASRPGCGSWESEQSIEAGAAKTVKVPKLKCESGGVADMSGWADKKFVRAVQSDGAPSARAASPWLFRPDTGKRVGSRTALLVVGSVTAGISAWLFIDKALEEEPGGRLRQRTGTDSKLVYAFLSGAVGVACLTAYFTGAFSGESPKDTVAVAPVFGGESGRGVAFSWSGQW